MISLLSDQAIGEGTLHTDGLGFETYARVLASAALDTRGPFTIGIFGEWGTGKTSLMRLVESELSDNPKVVTVWFNAWRYEQEEHPIVPLVGTIIHELERHKSFSERLKGSGQALIRALRAIAYGFSAKSKLKVPGFAEIEASFVAKDMIDREQRLTPDPLLDRSLYYEAFESLGAVKLAEDSRIVVLIDDLDRCFPDQAIRLLESIKLVLSQRGFIFMLGVARQVIEGYLQHRYSTEYGIANFQGQLYLDKIVQLPFHIPPNTGRMKEFCDGMLGSLSPGISGQLAGILPTVAEALGGNPRAVIRFINNILVDLAINTDLAESLNMEKIPVEYFALSRCLQQRWPQVFSTLLSAEGLSEAVAGWTRDTMRENAHSEESARASVAATLLSDLNLQILLSSGQGKSWLTNRDLRNASVNFLRSQQRVSAPERRETSARYDAFMSYAKEDSGDVSRIAEILVDHGLKIFMDTSISPGEDWRKVLEVSLHNSGSACICIGRQDKFSEWRELEISAAVTFSETGTRFRVIPVLLPGSDPKTLPGFLQVRQWVDLRSGITPKTVLPLADALKTFRDT